MPKIEHIDYYNLQSYITPRLTQNKIGLCKRIKILRTLLNIYILEKTSLSELPECPQCTSLLTNIRQITTVTKYYLVLYIGE